MLVIGIGHPERGDDGAGVAVVRLLGGHVGQNVRLLEMPSNVSRLLDCWDGADAVVVVDAMSSGATPGTVRRFDAAAASLPARAFRPSSTHGFGVAEVIELARTLGRLPRRLLVVGIEGACFDAGCGLSAPVENAVRDVVGSVERTAGSGSI